MHIMTLKQLNSSNLMLWCMVLDVCVTEGQRQQNHCFSREIMVKCYKTSNLLHFTDQGQWHNV